MKLLDECWEKTTTLLAQRGSRPTTLPTHLADATGSGGQKLRAACWTGPDAEARLVRIQGTAAGVFHALLLPHDSSRAPVFVAEVLLTGGKLRLAFVDVQRPGLLNVAPLRSAIAPLAARYHQNFHSEPAPDWATEFASGHQAYIRPAGQEVISMTEMYSDYLTLWNGLTPNSLSPQQCPELAAFKRRHATEAPVADYLSRLFGATWTTQFLASFLYR